MLSWMFLAVMLEARLCLSSAQDVELGVTGNILDADTMAYSKRVRAAALTQGSSNCNLSQVRAAVRKNAHSPHAMQIQHQDVLICETPKVGSLLLRSLLKVLTGNSGGSNIISSTKNEAFQLGRRLFELNDAEFLRYAGNGESVQRLMWVRHPVNRIISGWCTPSYHHVMCRGETLEARKEFKKRFGKFVRNKLQLHYRTNCSDWFRWSSHGVDQHVLPAQHCRCGLQCGIPYNIVKIEEISVPKGMELLGLDLSNISIRNKNKKIIPLTKRTRIHSLTADAKYGGLWPEVVKELNRITMDEMRLFEYDPYPVPEQLYDQE